MCVAGTSDHVRCFHCDGVLRHWDPEDDPWTEHARWFSRCGYVRLVKGDEFVQQAIAQRPPVLPAGVSMISCIVQGVVQVYEPSAVPTLCDTGAGTARQSCED